MDGSRVLFVCTGNTCRSPMARAIAEHMSAQFASSDNEFVFDSAGVAAGEGFEASKNALLAMNERGIDLSRHQSKMITPALVDWASVIYTMTPSHTQAIVHHMPASRSKVMMLDETQPISDPFGCSVEVYRDVANELEELIRQRLKEPVQ